MIAIGPQTDMVTGKDIDLAGILTDWIVNMEVTDLSGRKANYLVGFGDVRGQDMRLWSVPFDKLPPRCSGLVACYIAAHWLRTDSQPPHLVIKRLLESTFSGWWQVSRNVKTPVIYYSCRDRERGNNNTDVLLETTIGTIIDSIKLFVPSAERPTGYIHKEEAVK